MVTAFSTVSWSEAHRSFSIHIKAVRAHKTYLFYLSHVGLLADWATRTDLPIESFTKRHLDEYLATRADTGISKTTLRHDSLCAKVFTKWCKKNDILNRDPLADYEIRAAPKTHMYMPTEEDMVKLLEAVPTFWDPLRNTDARYISAKKRSFHRERNYAIIITLLDSACRIGEVLSLKLDDYQASQRQFTIRESKGRTSRVIPVSAGCAEAITEWLKVRKRVMSNVPKAEDEGWLFISELAGKIDESRFLKALKKITRYTGLSDNITLHSLRRYSLNKLSKVDVLGAQRIAGHKDTKTTLIYTEIDAGHLKDVHEKTGVVSGLLSSKRAVAKRRIL